jgi:hypothetical protein
LTQIVRLKGQQSTEVKYHQFGCCQCFHEGPPHKKRRIKKAIKPTGNSRTWFALSHGLAPAKSFDMILAKLLTGTFFQERKKVPVSNFAGRV